MWSPQNFIHQYSVDIIYSQGLLVSSKQKNGNLLKAVGGTIVVKVCLHSHLKQSTVFMFSNLRSHLFQENPFMDYMVITSVVVVQLNVCYPTPSPSSSLVYVALHVLF